MHLGLLSRSRLVISFIVIGLIAAAVVSRWDSGKATTEWSPMRLPFAGKRYISNGPNCSTHSGSSSEAIDFPMKRGTPVLAAQRGTVESVGQEPEFPSFGTVLKIRHDDRTVAWYTHLDNVFKQKGDSVLNGEVVAESGAGGGFDAHLHFEVRDESGKSVPIRELPGMTWFSNDLCGTGNKHAGVAFGAPRSDGRQTLLWFELRVPGIGRAGNRQPIAEDQSKPVRVRLNGIDGVAGSFDAIANYESESGSYIGVADLGENWPTEPYVVILRLPNTLGKRHRILPTIRENATTVLPQLVLKTGDIDDNNIINVLQDYDVLMGCYSVHRPASNCALNFSRQGSDLNDDGRVDYEDYDLFITMTSFVEGD